MGLPPAVEPSWQIAQARGVPINRPPVWHDAHSTPECPPLSGNPVLVWSKLLKVNCCARADITAVETTTRSTTRNETSDLAMLITSPKLRDPTRAFPSPHRTCRDDTRVVHLLGSAACSSSARPAFVRAQTITVEQRSTSGPAGWTRQSIVGSVKTGQSAENSRAGQN